MTKSADLLPMKYVVSTCEGHTWQAKAGVSAHSWVLGRRPCRAGAATTSSCSPAQIHYFQKLLEILKTVLKTFFLKPVRIKYKIKYKSIYTNLCTCPAMAPVVP